MNKRIYTLLRVPIILMIMGALLIGCGLGDRSEQEAAKPRVGIMLADYGLGDQSFNDLAFTGLMKARDELDVLFDYRDLASSGTYRQGLIELVEAECELVIGLGNNMVEDMAAVAAAYPATQFLFIDDVIDLPNVTSITFREDEGSFIVGAIAAMKSETGILGFIGGMDVPVIHRFRDGFIAGVHAVNPEAKVLIDYSNDFGNPEIGRALTKAMVEEQGADVVYPAAGYTGLGALEEAVEQGIYAIGVDSDQFYVAEQAVITSMLKNVDVAIYRALEEFQDTGTISGGHLVLGIEDNGVGAAPVRITSLSEAEAKQLEILQSQLLEGMITMEGAGR